jgi:hypothetical protein
LVVSTFLPCGHFTLHLFHRCDISFQALRIERVQLNFCHIQPAAMFRGKNKFKFVHQTFGRFRYCAPDGQWHCVWHLNEQGDFAHVTSPDLIYWGRQTYYSATELNRQAFTCQNSAHHGHPLGGQQGGIPMDEMDDYIQEIFDLIEWANGDAKTRWGKVRAEAGHPKP